MSQATIDWKDDSKSIGKRIFTAIKAKGLTGLAKEIAYNVLFAIAPLLIFVTALTVTVTRAVNADRAGPIEPVLS